MTRKADDGSGRSQLTMAQLDAIRHLAASGSPEQEDSGAPARADAAGPARTVTSRVAVWDTIHEVVISGAAAPTEDDLEAYIAAHPHCAVYQGQRASVRPGFEERSGLDQLAAALKEQAPPRLPGEAVKRAFTPEQLQRLQVRLERKWGRGGPRPLLLCRPHDMPPRHLWARALRGHGSRHVSPAPIPAPAAPLSHT